MYFEGCSSFHHCNSTAVLCGGWELQWLSSWLVRSSLDQAGPTNSQGHCVVFFGKTRHLTLTVPLYNQVY